MSFALRVASAVLLLCLCTRPAFADEKTQAREAFQVGVSAFQSGDYKTALARFKDADRAHHSPAITYNIARTLEKLEQSNAAVVAYESYIAEAGASGEFTSAATIAIAQIKGNSTRLRIDSSPPGARVSIDGEVLDDKTPVTVLVARGSHDITLALGDWIESRKYDAPGGGGTGEIVFVRSQAAPPPPPPAPKPERPAPPKPAPKRPEISGLMGTAGVSLSLYRFVGSAEETTGQKKTTADSAPTGLVFGLAFDVGLAVSTRTALFLRGFGGLGSAQESLASLGAGGPVLSVRITDRWWFGGGVVVGAGRADSDATQRNAVVDASSDAEVTFETDVALGPTLELSYVMDQNEDGHWTASLMPSTLFTTSGEESTLFVPLMLGYRWF